MVIYFTRQGNGFLYALIYPFIFLPLLRAGCRFFFTLMEFVYIFKCM